MTYTSQPGTVAARALEAINQIQPGQEVTSAVLLEAIGQPADWQGLNNCLMPAVEAGLITRRLEGRRSWWSRGTGMPCPRTKDQPLTVEPEQPRKQAKATTQAPLEDHTAIDDLEPASRPRVATAAEAVLRKSALHGSSTCTESQTPAAPPATEQDEDCEFAITSAGRLLINAGEQRIALSKAQADQLMAYLDQARGLEWEATA